MSGSWQCPACSTTNPSAADRCMTCEAVRIDGNVPAPGPNAAGTAPGLGPPPSPTNWVCRQCQRSNGAHLHNCGSCNAPRSQPGFTEAPTSVMAPVAGPPPTPPAPAESSRPAWVPVAIGAALLLVAAVAGALTFTIFSGDDDSSEQRVATERSSDDPAETTIDEVDGGEGPPPGNSDGEAPTLSTPEPEAPVERPVTTTAPSAPVTSPHATTPTAPSPSPSPSPPSPGLLVPGTTPPGGMGSATANGAGLALMPTGSWVLVLESTPHSEGLAAAEARAQAFTPGSVHLVDTADHPGMTPGYYAVVVGPYGSKDSARDGCHLVGRELGGTCYDRPTS